ncbi:unnamed protein product [Owenia fusiformis]|uniref:Sulfatase N-terminal domain-containing protein n=1 Tax=Owenia fusiformis TaxID=6347 RepID=A0A8S4N4V5_OWEFU|nr:unnamed protein product [Owenia fusiformis]
MVKMLTKGAFFILLLIVVAANNTKKRSKPPNIVFILADDLGWNDVGWHNVDVKTPNLNKLAYEGVIFNYSYTQPTCSPSRAAILTGRYPFMTGTQRGIIGEEKPYGLPLKYELMSDRLKRLGYSTHIVGKWHLGYCKWEYTPTFRGFDSFYGFLNGAQDYYTHLKGAVHSEGVDFRNNKRVVIDQFGVYSTHSHTKRAVKVIKHHNNEKPFFLYLPFQAVHTPLQVPKQYTDQYGHIKDNNRRIFLGMVSALDEAVGNITKALRKNRMLRDTLIVFTSDNGGNVHGGGNNWPLRGGKTTLFEGGTRVPTFVWGKMIKRRRRTTNGLFHAVDWVPTLLHFAGGKTEKELDGVNQWSMINQNKASNRKEMVYTINEVTKVAAIRIGKYKLIEGFPGRYRSWYPPPHSPMKYWKSVYYNLFYVRHNHRRIWLYNVKDDPQETTDLSRKLYWVVKRLRKKLRDYKKGLVPAIVAKSSPKSNPIFWGGAWSPGWC